MRRWLPLLAWSIVILVASGDTFSSDNTGRSFYTLFGFEVPYVLHVAIRKLAHLVVYGIHGALGMRASGRFRAAMAMSLVLALVDEFHQSTTSTRTGNAGDVLIDAIGATLGAFIVRRFGTR